MGDVKTYTTGVKGYRDAFNWKVERIRAVAHSDLLEFQSVEHKAWKDHNTAASVWRVSLITRYSRNDTTKSIGFSVRALSLPESIEQEKVKVTVKCIVISHNGEIPNKVSRTMPFNISLENTINFGSIPLLVPDHLVDSAGCLTMNWVFKFYGVLNRNTAQKRKLEDFVTSAKAKTSRDIYNKMRQAESGDVVILVSSDKVRFPANRRVLSARSPVFEAMFRSNMKEGRTRTVEIPDISSNPLRVLLHFILYGELRPEWNSKEIILGLTYAAHKYDVPDLIKFLDESLGNYCNSQTACEFLRVANRLSLKIAEEQIMKFIRERMVTTLENLNTLVAKFSSTDERGTDSGSDGDNGTKKEN